jgi:hypothetical protein
VTGFCEHSNEPSGSIKVGTFLAQLMDFQTGLDSMESALICRPASCSVLMLKSTTKYR